MALPKPYVGPVRRSVPVVSRLSCLEMGLDSSQTVSRFSTSGHSGGKEITAVASLVGGAEVLTTKGEAARKCHREKSRLFSAIAELHVSNTPPLITHHIPWIFLSKDKTCLISSLFDLLIY